jgi:hypothetical protein
MVPCCGFVGSEFEFRQYVCAWDGICTDAICKDKLGNAGKINCC